MSLKEKQASGNQWAKDIINYVTNFHAYVPSMSTSYAEMERNYKLFNNIINQKDFEAECNPLGIEVGTLEDEIKPYNKIPNKIQVLLGEELRRPFNFKAVSISEEGIKSKLRKQDKMLKDYIKGMLQVARVEAAKEVGDMPQDQAEKAIQEIVNDILPPEMIDKYIKTSYQDSNEILANKILSYLTHVLDLRSKKNDALKHGLISDFEGVWVGIEDGLPAVNPLNSLATFYHKTAETKFVENGLYAGYRVRMTTLDVMNLFGQYLTDEEINRIQTDPGSLGLTSVGAPSSEMTYRYSETSRNFQSSYLTTPLDGSYGKNFSLDHLVTHIEWQSESKIGYLTTINEYGDFETNTVTEDFPIPVYAEVTQIEDEWGAKQMVYSFDDAILKFQWVPQVWSGIRIGQNIFVKIGPKPYQIRDAANPRKVKLGYHGAVYSNMNAHSCSMVSRAAPFQNLYFIVMHKLKHLIARDKGVLLNIDVTQLPDNIDQDKLMYYIEQMDMNFYNPLQNAEKPGSHQRGSATSTENRSNMQHIMNYVQLLDALDLQISDVMGVNRQREGQITSSEAVTNSQQNLAQSAVITESYFYLHNKIWENVYNSLLEVACYAWKDKEMTFQWILDDLSAHTLQIKPGDLSFGAMGIQVLDSSKQHEAFEFAKQHFLELLQNDKAKFSDMLSMFQTNSLAELKRTIEKSEQELQERAQQEQQFQQDLQDKQLKAASDFQAQKHQDDMEIEQLRADNKIRIAEIDVFKFQKDLDSNNDGVPDPLEIEKLKATIQSNKDKMALEREKLKQTADLKEKDLKIKEKALRMRPKKS